MGHGMIQLASVVVGGSRVSLVGARVAVTAAVSISATLCRPARMVDHRPGVTAAGTRDH